MGWGNAVSVCWCGRLCSNTCSDDAAAFYTAVDAAARAAKTTDPAESRTLDQLRADVVAALGWSALAAGHLGCCHPDCEHPNRRLGGRHGRAATVNVTVGYTTLIGADDQPAHLDGYGPITADVARSLAADGVWRRLLTDPATGAVLDSAPPGIGRRPSWPTTWWPGTGPAASPRAPTPPPAATSTTPSRTRPAGRPATPTPARCTAATTSTRPTTGGSCPNPKPAGSSGPHPPATATRSNPRSSDYSPNPHPPNRNRSNPTPTPPF